MSAFPEIDPGASGLHAAWYAANSRHGALTAQRCACGRWRAPARYRCASCGGPDWTFESLEPSAVVESWTVTRRPLHFAFADVVPYAIVVAVTQEGPRFLLQFRSDPDTLEVGASVDVAVDRFGVPFATGR